MQATGSIKASPPAGSALEGAKPTVTSVLRQLRGGSQSTLVRCSDGKLYVMKVSSNPQGVQVLANEVLGAHLLEGLGLPVPPSRRVLLTRNTIQAFPLLRIVGLDRISREPEEGEQFASEFLEKADHEIFNLPGSYQPSPDQIPHTVPMYVFDVWAYHRDLRQCVFRRNRSTGSWESFYIDNGLLFGGPEWAVPLSGLSAARSDYFSPPIASDLRIDAAIDRFSDVLPTLLHHAIQQVPTQWIKGDIHLLKERLLIRLSNLRSLVDQDLERYEPSRGKAVNRRSLLTVNETPTYLPRERTGPLRCFP